MNCFFDNTKSKGIGTSVNSDSGTNLISGNFLDIIPLALQNGKCMIAEGNTFFLIISVSDSNAETLDSQLAFLNIFK